MSTQAPAYRGAQGGQGLGSSALSQASMQPYNTLFLPHPLYHIIAITPSISHPLYHTLSYRITPPLSYNIPRITPPKPFPSYNNPHLHPPRQATEPLSAMQQQQQQPSDNNPLSGAVTGEAPGPGLVLEEGEGGVVPCTTARLEEIKAILLAIYLEYR